MPRQVSIARRFANDVDVLVPDEAIPFGNKIHRLKSGEEFLPDLLRRVERCAEIGACLLRLLDDHFSGVKAHQLFGIEGL